MREFAIAIWQEKDGEIVAGWIDRAYLPGRWSYQVATCPDVVLHVNVMMPRASAWLIKVVIEDHLRGIELGAGEQIA